MGYAKIYEEIKRGKCPEPRKRKKKIAHVLPKQRSKKRRGSNMRSNEK